MGWRSQLDGLAAVSMTVASTCIVWAIVTAGSTQEPPVGPGTSPLVPPLPISTEGSAAKGRDTAPVTLLVVSDFQCPYCAAFSRDVLPVLEREFIESGHLRIVFWHFPLPNHPMAAKAAVAAECARRQGRFWEAHDAIFQLNLRFDQDQLVRVGAGLDLDHDVWRRCLDGDAGQAVADSVGRAREFGFRATPAFFVGLTEQGSFLRVLESLAGAKPADEFRRTIQRALQVVQH